MKIGIQTPPLVALTLKHPLPYPTDMKPLEAYFIGLMMVIIATEYQIFIHWVECDSLPFRHDPD